MSNYPTTPNNADNTSVVLPYEDVDPAELGFPHMLPVELALGEEAPRQICESYGIDKDAFTKMCANPAFVKAVKDAKDMLQKDGMGFRVKARMQSEALLKTSWAIIHAQHTGANVKADLIKATWKVAGFEPKSDERTAVAPLNIQINL